MVQILNIILVLFFISSCSTFKQRDKKRKIQTEVLKVIYAQKMKLKKCAKNQDLFKKLSAERIRFTLLLSINQKGSIHSFSLQETIFPQKFGECLFKNLEKVKFPTFLDLDYEKIDVIQPFILSQE